MQFKKLQSLPTGFYIGIDNLSLLPDIKGLNVRRYLSTFINRDIYILCYFNLVIFKDFSLIIFLANCQLNTKLHKSPLKAVTNCPHTISI